MSASLRSKFLRQGPTIFTLTIPYFFNLFLMHMHNPVHEKKHIIATNYVGLASYTFLVYDHLLTFSDEVEYVWFRRKGPVVYLFFINRYIFPLAFIVNLYAYISPKYSPSNCAGLVIYEGSLSILAVANAGLVMIFRVNALYGGDNQPALATLGFLWLAQVGVSSFLVSSGMPVPHTPGIHSCTLIFNPERRKLSPLFSILPLVFDTTVLILTLHKTKAVLRTCKTSNAIVQTLQNDGILYYSILFAANFTLTFMLIFAPPGLKNILQQFVQLATTTIISRITLHLKKQGRSLYVNAEQITPPATVTNETSTSASSGSNI
ncbi:hypothetical protein PNOK_0685800 [Pyrrhoderma noxium]|uniref:DUF6533 domain-containing protein n=1 Tax=Pyrrhoderma noxium TaxID=2282107 RepID=A0A286UB85_9AGAM|nr:hypothetical protein PNOK_0685800 [Pyrrhoderma noxium]